MSQHRYLVFFVLLATIFIHQNAFSASKGITPEQSLDDDLSGSAVTWVGEITNVYEAGSDACILMNKLDDFRNVYVYSSNKFITCTAGSVQDEMFLKGRLLQVTGNLGKNTLRSIAGHDIQAYLIAAPIIKPISDVSVYKNRPYYNDSLYRSYDPFYDPWYPYGGVGIGIGIGNHHHHRH